MVRELRTLVVVEGCHPTEKDVLDAWDYANTKSCYVELKWLTEHYGWKSWYIDPERNTLEELYRDLVHDRCVQH